MRFRKAVIVGASVILAGCATTPPAEAPQPPQEASHAPKASAWDNDATLLLQRAVAQHVAATPKPETTEIPVATAIAVELSVDEEPVAQGRGYLYELVLTHFSEMPDKAYRVMMCESTGDPEVISPNGLYHGLWQFDEVTWNGVGGEGLPSDASPEEQTMRARVLYDMRGWQPWPHCGLK